MNKFDLSTNIMFQHTIILIIFFAKSVLFSILIFSGNFAKQKYTPQIKK